MRKRHLALLAIIMTVCTVFIYSHNTMSAYAYNTSTNYAAPTVLTYLIDTGDLEISTVGEFTLLHLGDAVPASEVGKPLVPVKTIAILIPPSSAVKDLKVTASCCREIYLRHPLMPAQPPASPIPHGASDQSSALVIDTSIYMSREPYPGRIYEFNGRVHLLRGHKIVLVTLYPVQYIPAENKILFYRCMRIELSLKHSEAELHRFMVDQLTLSYIRELVINPELLSTYIGSPLAFNAGNRYLIITRSTFVNSGCIGQLVEILEGLGFTVYVKLVEDIKYQYGGRDLPEKIRNCIKTYYNVYGISYVLLFGDADPDDVAGGAPNYVLDKSWEVPVRYVVNPDKDRNCDEDATGLPNDLTPTDYYYAGLDSNWDSDYDLNFGESNEDEVDWLADVYAGRVPVRTYTDAWRFVSKLSSYISSLGERVKRVLLVGAVLFEDTDGAWAKYVVHEFYPPNVTVIGLYESAGTLSYSSAEAYLASLDPVGVNTCSHGGITALYLHEGPPFVDDETAGDVSNTGAIWYAAACLSGAFDVEESVLGPSLGEVMLRDEDGPVLAYVEATRCTWIFRSEALFLTGCSGMTDWLFWCYMVRYGSYGPGYALYKAKARYYIKWSSYMNDEAHRKVLFTEMLLGEPAMPMFFSYSPEPVSGTYHVGDYITVHGAGFHPNSVVSIYFEHFDESNFLMHRILVVSSVMTDSGGELVHTFRIPDVAPNVRYDIIAVDEYGNIALLGNILVLGPLSPPPPSPFADVLLYPSLWLIIPSTFGGWSKGG